MKKIGAIKRAPTDDGFDTIERNFDLILGFVRARLSRASKEEAFAWVMQSAHIRGWHPFEVIQYIRREYYPELKKYL